MPKVSWLDSTRMESNIHITREGDLYTLCGYGWKDCFALKIWIPFRSGGKKHKCAKCFKEANLAGIDTKEWLSEVPERDFTKTKEELKQEARQVKGSLINSIWFDKR